MEYEECTKLIYWLYHIKLLVQSQRWFFFFYITWNFREICLLKFPRESRHRSSSKLTVRIDLVCSRFCLPQPFKNTNSNYRLFHKSREFWGLEKFFQFFSPEREFVPQVAHQQLNNVTAICRIFLAKKLFFKKIYAKTPRICTWQQQFLRPKYWLFLRRNCCWTFVRSTRPEVFFIRGFTETVSK